MPQINGDNVESESDDLEEISWKWFSEYFSQFHGIFVPPNCHVVHARIEDTELLTDLDTPYIQIDYEVYAPFGGSGIVKDLDLMDTDTRGLYTGQMVLCWESDGDDVYRITEKMSPVQYQISTPEFQKESRIRQSGFAANPFLSVTDNGYYVTMAVDRSLGNDYYGTYYSGDLENWTSITLPDYFCTNLTCSFWTRDGKGYYAKGGEMMVTLDGGETFQDIMVPEAEEITGELGFNPFDAVEKMYEKDGILYVVMGQGDDGDYMKDGKLAEALYRSEDGVNFSFVEEIADDTPEQAG